MKKIIVALSVLCACSTGFASQFEMTKIFAKCTEEGFAERNRIIADYVNAVNSEDAKSTDPEKRAKIEEITRIYHNGNANNFFMPQTYSICLSQKMSPNQIPSLASTEK